MIAGCAYVTQPACSSFLITSRTFDGMISEYAVACCSVRGRIEAGGILELFELVDERGETLATIQVGQPLLFR